MDAGALRQAGNTAFKHGRFAEAIDLYTRVIDLNPSAVAYTNRSAARLKVGQHEEALSDAEHAVSLTPTHAKAYFRIAAASRALKRPDAAIKALQQVLELVPGDAAATQALDEVRTKAGYGKAATVALCELSAV